MTTQSPQPDDLISGLSELTAGTRTGSMKVLEYFGDQPKMLDAICKARKEQKLSHEAIASYFTKKGYPMRGGAVKNWLKTQGIE